MGWGLAYRNPVSQGPEHSPVQLSGPSAPAGEAEPRAVRDTAHSGIQTLQRPHKTCSPCREEGHGAVGCGGDGAMPGGATMPVRTP